jgi:3-hydroxyisobutyrate dehydrogenase
MGGPMARNLIKAGHSLVVFDVVQRNVDALTAAGATPRPSRRNRPPPSGRGGHHHAALLAAREERVPGRGGVLAGVAAGVPLIDSSTIDPHTAREVAARPQNTAIPWRTRRCPAARAARKRAR